MRNWWWILRDRSMVTVRKAYQYFWFWFWYKSCFGTKYVSLGSREVPVNYYHCTLLLLDVILVLGHVTHCDCAAILTRTLQSSHKIMISISRRHPKFRPKDTQVKHYRGLSQQLQEVIPASNLACNLIFWECWYFLLMTSFDISIPSLLASAQTLLCVGHLLMPRLKKHCW